MAYKFNKEAAARKRAEQVNEGIKIIEEEVPRFFQSEKWKNYLCFVSKFHKYSINNTILIFHQRPDASMVAGYQNWKKMGRTVNKGEKGIMIFVPTPYKVHMQEKLKDQNGNPVFDENGDEKTEKKEIKKMAFRIGHVFDVKQTSGDPIPQLTSPLVGDEELSSKYIQLAEKITRCPIFFKDKEQDLHFETGAFGYYSVTRDCIVVRSDLSEMQKLKTLLHEIAHSYLHSGKEGEHKEKEQRECEAESTAFILCRHLGIDTSEYSFGYLASWAENKDANFLKGVLSNISAVSNTLIEKLDQAMYETSEKNQDNAG
ncbi:ArdC-like ssDNA-binding domain-containing protein [Bilifractor sp. LCP19S3_H10]|uniref:ArdC-like ssDNA-binding domain-containing protein n=1 Tax=Bilifractor sp. LCP19S3_H10 TaxID=3438736 RepID=UPI003F8DF714